MLAAGVCLFPRDTRLFGFSAFEPSCWVFLSTVSQLRFLSHDPCRSHPALCCNAPPNLEPPSFKVNNTKNSDIFKTYFLGLVTPFCSVCK